jgi:hypothetical protein
MLGLYDDTGGRLAAALPRASIGLWVLVVSLGGQGAQRGVLGARNCRAAAGLRSTGCCATSTGRGVTHAANGGEAP